MKQTLICCSNCGKMAEKPQKEITRQHKKGNYNFFCARLCYRQYQAKNHSQSWDAVHHRARYIFERENKSNLVCFFCSKGIRSKYHVHHIDGNFQNNNISNLAPAHEKCHNKYHNENYKIRKVRATGSPTKKALGIA